MINQSCVRDIFQNKNVVMFVASIVFMLGILACFYNQGIVLAAIITVLLIFLLFFRVLSIRKIFVFILIFYSGFFLTFCKIKSSDSLLSMAPMSENLSGRIVSIPSKIEKDKVKFFFEVDKFASKNVKGKTYVTVLDDENSLNKYNIGQSLIIKGNLRKPFTSTNPSQFDYSSYLKNFGVFTVLYANSSDIKIVDSELPFKWKFLQGLNNTRERILNVHGKYLKSPNLEILGGIVFGDDAVPPPDYVKNSFINSGLLHILAASGMNVAFIFTFWFYILRFLKVPYKPRVISGILVIILYTLMTGLGPSVIRAALMLIFVLLGKLIDRDAHSVSLLSFVAVLMLIYNPAYINNVSFQLSFLVTFGLLTTANIIAQKLEAIPNWLKVPILIPIVAQVWVVPVQMFYFNSFSLYSVLANISTVCLLSLISFIGFVSSVISVIQPFADFVCRVADFILNYLLNILLFISNFFSGLKYCIIQTSHPSIIQLVLYYFMLIGFTYLIKFEKYKKSLILVCCLSFIIFILGVKPVSHNLEIIAFDVQNADSFLIKTPENKYFMIDTGKAPYKSGNSQAKIIMLKYLKDRGIKNLEGVIVTHFDNDHSGGVVDVISNVHVENLYLNSKHSKTDTAKNIYKAVVKNNQSTKIISGYENIYNEPDFSLKLYKASGNSSISDNEASIITLLSYKNFDMLFMGDAGVVAFNNIKSQLPRNVEVLKVGHHGGPNVVDSSMIEYLGNKVSLISTGLNYFGHPNKGTLDVLRNTEILRTDFLHSIKISTDGNLYEIFSYNPHEKIYKFRENFYSK